MFRGKRQKPEIENQYELAKRVFSWSFIFIAAFVVVMVTAWYVDYFFLKSNAACLEDGQSCPPVSNGGASLPFDIFTTILPIVTAWIGVVLGYYFSDRAAENRGEQVLDAAKSSGFFRERLSQVRVADVMIDESRIKKVILNDSEPSKITNAFKELKDAVSEPGYTRAPMFVRSGDDLIFKYIAHESAIYKYEAEVLRRGEDPDTKKIGDFLNDPSVERYIRNTTGFVAANATLRAAKDVMELTKGCQDVFVTADGTAHSAVQGWLPNVWLLRKSVASADD